MSPEAQGRGSGLSEEAASCTCAISQSHLEHSTRLGPLDLSKLLYFHAPGHVDCSCSLWEPSKATRAFPGSAGHGHGAGARKRKIRLYMDSSPAEHQTCTNVHNHMTGDKCSAAASLWSYLMPMPTSPEAKAVDRWASRSVATTFKEFTVGGPFVRGTHPYLPRLQGQAPARAGGGWARQWGSVPRRPAPVMGPTLFSWRVA